MAVSFSLCLAAVIIFSVSAFLMDGGNSQGSSAQSSKPHIVFVLADDLGHADIGYHGSWIQTPVLDQMAAEGVKLENYYVQPMCGPSRSQLLSGRYQIHTGLQHDNLNPTQPLALPLDSPTLADKLKEAGYATHMLGKWHQGFFKKEYMPHYRGFDTFYGSLTGSQDHYDHTHSKFLDLRYNDEPDYNQTGVYSTHLYTQKAVELINAHDASEPLFLYLAYQAVHSPVQVPQSYKDLYHDVKDKTRRKYAGMVTCIDEGVGNITQALREVGLWNNTILVFSTDNGGRAKKGGYNYPLRGEKHSLWEGGMKAIGFVSGGLLTERQGVVSNGLIHISDWYPTLLGVAGASLNGTKPLDGVDQWQSINKGMPSSRKVLLHNIDTLKQKRGERLYNDTFDTRVRAAVRSGDLKLITGYPDTGYWFAPPETGLKNEKDKKESGTNVWLFNITDDPFERNNLANKRPDEVKMLLDILQEFQDTAVEPYYPANDPNGNPSRNGGVWAPWM